MTHVFASKGYDVWRIDPFQFTHFKTQILPSACHLSAQDLKSVFICEVLAVHRQAEF